MSRGAFRPYVPVRARRKRAEREVRRLREHGRTVEPVEIEGRKIVRSFWGKAWCGHLESYSDWSNRLPRGRTYVRNGSVCHLAVGAGHVQAVVSGSDLYEVDVRVRPLGRRHWNGIKERCAGRVGSMLELLQGRLSDEVMAVVTDPDGGMFPSPREIELECSCPDYARLCKHLAAVLYGIGHRLDSQPELLFTLRGVDPQELIAAEVSLPRGPSDSSDAALSDDELGDIFGIELDTGDPPAPEGHTAPAQGPKQTGAAEESADELPRLRPSGKSVARLRRKAGYTPAEMAKELGVTPATVHRWEATPGRLRLRAASYRALALLHRRVSGT